MEKVLIVLIWVKILICAISWDAEKHFAHSKLPQNTLFFNVKLLNGASGLDRSALWMIRMKVIEQLLSRHFNTFVSDLDAIPTTDVLSIFQSLQLHHPPLDIIGSRGRFPFDISEKWEFSSNMAVRLIILVCMGFVHFSNSSFSLSVIQAAIYTAHYMRRTDDQRAINAVIDTMEPIWLDHHHLNRTINMSISRWVPFYSHLSHVNP